MYEGWKRGLFIELDDKEVELSHCFYGNRILVSDLKKSEQIDGYYDEIDANGNTLTTSQYTADRTHKKESVISMRMVYVWRSIDIRMMKDCCWYTSSKEMKWLNMMIRGNEYIKDNMY